MFTRLLLIKLHVIKLAYFYLYLTCIVVLHKNFVLLRIHIIYTFCKDRSNSPGPIQNRTGLVKKNLGQLISDTVHTYIHILCVLFSDILSFD